MRVTRLAQLLTIPVLALSTGCGGGDEDSPETTAEQAERAMERGQLTARGYGRVLRLAWTLADLSGATVPGPEHVGHALGFRLGRTRLASVA